MQIQLAALSEDSGGDFAEGEVVGVAAGEEVVGAGVEGEFHFADGGGEDLLGGDFESVPTSGGAEGLAFDQDAGDGGGELGCVAHAGAAEFLAVGDACFRVAGDPLVADEDVADGGVCIAAGNAFCGL